MALKLNEQYPGRFNNPSASYPQGSFKNRTTPTAEDGSYFEQAWANDQLAFFSSLLSFAGVSPNGMVDEVGASQYFDALSQIIDGYSVDMLDTVRLNISSATTINLTDIAPNTRHINITGSINIDAFTVAAGSCYFVRFGGSFTLTNSASLVTNTGANLKVVSGDSCILRATADNTVEVICFSTVKKYTQGPQVSLSGTSVDYLSIPSWVKRITINIHGMGGSGTSPHIIQLGTSSDIQTTGYGGSVSSEGAGANQVQMSNGFNLEASVNAASRSGGGITLENLGGNIWCMRGQISKSNAILASNSSGSVSLSGALDRIRLTTVGGVDTFVAGSFSVSYEG